MKKSKFSEAQIIIDKLYTIPASTVLLHPKKIYSCPECLNSVVRR